MTTEREIRARLEFMEQRPAFQPKTIMHRPISDSLFRQFAASSSLLNFDVSL